MDVIFGNKLEVMISFGVELLFIMLLIKHQNSLLVLEIVLKLQDVIQQNDLLKLH